jgi:hypothetical protein
MPNKKSETEETHAMPHPPNKDSIKGLLPADFDCTQQPLPDKLKVLLCLLDGAERRQRLQTKFESPCPQQFVDSPADVHWTSADQVLDAEPGTEGNQRHFESLRKATDFVMEELTIADRANVWIATEQGNLTLEQIKTLRGLPRG